ncbi:Bifunctional purine biosynthesis protein PurH [Coemansia aciculifera]|uniref:Bifunctional purine biosynthesis protein PurH n=1 Tax=Coemansia aciculifera TaxID=417176 RepID=A0ACC1LV06_9FUNG|nr:Bifunctional purine biosynthesis protein PurH [Coemansia aciculifera]
MVLSAYFGRRTLLIFSHLSMAIFAALIVPGSVRNVAALVVVAVFCFNAFFNLGVGPIPWAAASEMTPRYAMTAVSAIGTGIGYIGTFVIGIIFPPLNNWWKNYTFLFFMAWNIIAAVFIYFFIPETRDRPIEDTVRKHSCGIHLVVGKKWQVPPIEEKAALGELDHGVVHEEDRALLGDTISTTPINGTDLLDLPPPISPLPPKQ